MEKGYEEHDTAATVQRTTPGESGEGTELGIEKGREAGSKHALKQQRVTNSPPKHAHVSSARGPRGLRQGQDTAPVCRAAVPGHHAHSAAWPFPACCAGKGGLPPWLLL